MRYCINCHALLSEEDVFCKKCGTKVEYAEKLSSEESIALANELERKYSELHSIKSELDQCQKDLPRYQLPDKRPRYSAFRFFWPFLIYSQIAELVVGIIFIVILVNGLLSGRMSTEYDTDSLKTVMMFFMLVAAAATVIFGGVYATRKRDRLNAKLAEDELPLMQKKSNIISRIGELNNMKSHLEYELKQYNSWIPVTLRNPSGIRKARSYIESGEAKDLYEAVMLCQNKW